MRLNFYLHPLVFIYTAYHLLVRDRDTTCDVTREMDAPNLLHIVEF